MISIRQQGDFSKLSKYLEKLTGTSHIGILNKYGQAGVAALAAATPVDSGQTANSWYYEIEHDGNGTTISFNNSNIQNGIKIAIILDAGHGTGTGGWVEGRHYIDPAIQPIFDQIAKEAWEEVTKL